MGLQALSLMAGSTGLSVTGGSALGFASDGQTVPNGTHLVVPSDTNYATRRHATFRYRAPALDSAGVYSKDKKTVSFAFPKVLASGKVVVNVLRIEREVHPETSAAEAVEMNRLAAQMLFDTDLDNFWGAGSLA